MKMTWIVLGIVALSIFGYGLYWQHRMSPLMEMQGLELRPTRLELVPTSAVRPVNLGFAEFNLPARLSGELVRHDDSLFVSVFNDPEKRTGLTICPPNKNDSPEVLEFLQDYARFTDEPVPTFFEVRKRALGTIPFSVWSIPFRGIKRSRSDALLLALKAWETGSVTRVELFERPELGVIISYRPDFTEVLFADKTSGVEQRFLLSAGVSNPAELAAALASSYRFTTDLREESALLSLLAATGIRQQVTAMGEPADEMARLGAIADEVHQRRQKRQPAVAPE